MSKDKHKNGVGIVIDKHLKDSVVTITRKGEWIISVKLVIGESIVNIISTYVSLVGLDDLIKEQFWEQMDDVVQAIPFGEKLFIRGDFNGHVGVHKQGYEKVHGGFGFGDLNEGGRRILDFAVAFDLIVENTLYRKQKEHLITFKSGANGSQIDYFLARGANRLTCKDCKGLRGEKLEVFKERMSQEVQWGVEGDSDNMWNTIADDIRRISKEVLGELKGKCPISKETLWWNA
ncbi:uncharacterized protein LOC131323748 [Rhododendron vialii]|uniref:uncharacterized protein LOC131323748 n=1 Tax=Rhododendron vialii TaxID=182163 RepID=UPI00265E7419|nr:uncharacterized protein LOC131323748 [Rhododendron vialii]